MEATQSNKMLQLALNARNFALAQENGYEILTPCATSQGIMFSARKTLDSDNVLKSQVNEILEKTSDLTYDGTISSRHLLHILVEEIGLDKIAEKVVNPLGIKVAGYYGPNMQRKGACGSSFLFLV